MSDGSIQALGVELTDRAARRIAEIREAEGNLDLMLRLEVLGGGCSGFQYKFELDDTLKTDDKVFDNGGTSLVIDEASLGLLDGSVIDFKEDLGASFFAVSNPNASSNCGCGASFAI
ncbi:MAG: iron-sulfur cluster insertion protein ErpA [Magnetovibrio sp.]|nr:iron-sulfur cluster insertion protein ErpA [Magnetovibrio sp.]|tara:strand:+ start:839 stop:1189 length:351 start_codon:yes stop_codon:yes gene_type:complete